jgi:cobalt-zinc-cadmium efflux system outer membrane protein
MNRTLTAATLVVASVWHHAAAAQGAPGQPTGCRGPLDAETVARCALAASPEVREARERLAAISGRRTSAGIWLPSNPTVSATLSNRHRPPPPEAVSVLNWNVVLSQELEIAGQRGARLDAADAEAAAQARRVGVAEQEVAAGALTAYYDAVAANEAGRFAGALARNAEALATFAEGRAKEALLAGVEADVARAEATHIALARLEAERRLAEARAALAVLLDVDARALQLPDSLPVSAGPEPANAALEEQALRLRGEVAAAEMERRVLERRLVLIRRERVPNLTLSAFAERGEINDRILGVGLSIPLPLPSPIGRTRAGEIAETLAQIRAAESSVELVRRRVRLEVARARAVYTAREGAASLFAADLLGRARADLAALRDAISARQLSLREALQWQRSLIELLQADIEARLGRALALTELRRVAGAPLVAGQGGGR